MTGVLETILAETRVLLKQSGPPGPPPRPGLECKEETHRWVRPLSSGEKAEGKSSVETKTPPKKGDVVTVPMYDGTGSSTARVVGRPFKDKWRGDGYFVPVRDEFTQWSVLLDSVKVKRPESKEEGRYRKDEDAARRRMRQRGPIYD